MIYYSGIALVSTRFWSESSVRNAKNSGEIEFTAKTKSCWVLDLPVNSKYTSTPDSWNLPYEILTDCKKEALT